MTTIRPFEADDDLAPELDLRHRAFGPIGPGYRETLIAQVQACAADGRLIGAFEGREMIGSARYFDLRQWWYGRELPMAGVAGVKVAPEARGRGIGRTLMTGLLSAMNERGYPLSVLTLTVGDGTGSLVKAGSASDGAPPEAAALGPRGFAALFAGVPMATLRVAGLAVGGDPAADALLDSAFACAPFMLDMF